MKQFLQLIVLVALAFYNAIQTVTGGATLKRLAPSGVIDQGILGGFSGKVGPVVGGKWKDIDYMRGYVVPANPNTPAQQAVRAKFSALVSLGRQILSSVCQAFWDPFYSNMSGFNAWISVNYSLSDTAGVIDETAIMSKGTLQPLPGVNATYDTGDGTIQASWDNTLSGNALSTDSIYIVGLDSTGQILTGGITAATRNDATGDIQIGAGLTAADVVAFVFAYRGTGSELIVSDSNSAICTAA